jgi:tRNA(Arg) A34 adenosine deaminase TadA
MKQKLLQEAVRLARKKNSPVHHPDWGGFQHFSFIVQDGVILGHASNMPGQVPSFLGYSAEAKWHAETYAFRRVKGLLNKDKTFNVINIRLSRQNALRYAAPCPVCLARLKKYGCEKIYFSTDDGFKHISTNDKIKAWCGYNMPSDKFDCQVQNTKGLVALLATGKVAHLSVGPFIDDAERNQILQIIKNYDKHLTVGFHGHRASGS